MANINFELNLNKHPKDVPNRALVSANNVQLSNDFSCLQSEFCIKENNNLKQELLDKYIAGYIPCNKEFILFVAPKTWKTDLLESKGIFIDIYRFREQGELKDEQGNWKDIEHRNSFDSAEWKIVYSKFLWHGGKLKGTFTYNIKSQLIIAIAESDTYTEELIPLKTINLGTWNDDSSSTDTDLNLNDSQLSLNPEIKVPAIIDYNYVNGLAYKGWYSFFIRYKINSIDYTKWYDVGFPILIDELEKVQLFNYFIKGKIISNSNTVNWDYIGNSIKDYISSGSNTCNKTIELTIDNKNNNFLKYQIGIIQSVKDSTKTFKTLDIDISTNNFLLDFSSLEEYEANDLIFEKYNYYNVKNIINYKNRLYISNYNESLVKNINLSSLISNFYVQIKRKEFIYRQTSELLPDIDLCLFKDLQQNYVDIPAGASQGRINFSFSLNGSWAENDDLYFNGYVNYRKGLHDSDNPGDTHSINAILIEKFNPRAPGSFGNIVTVTDRIDDSVLTINIDFNGIIETSEQTATHPDKWNITGTCSGYVEVIKVQAEPVITNPEDNYHSRLKNTTLLPGETYNFYIHFVNKYGESTDGIKLNISPRYGQSGFISYGTENDDGSVTIDGAPNDKYIESNIKCYIYYPVLVISNPIPKDYFISRFGEYVGFYLTYEKFQKTKQFCGILSRYDFYYVNGASFNYDTSKAKANYEKYLRLSGKADNDGKYKFKFYCTDIDTLDAIELNFTKLRIEARTFPSMSVYATNNINDTAIDDTIDEQASTIFSEIKEYNILNAHYVGAHNFSKENEYRGSYIEIELEDPDAFLSDMGIPKTNDISEQVYNFGDFIFKAILLADTKNLYLSENKTLIKFTNNYYFDEMDFDDVGLVNTDFYSQRISILYGLNGFCTFNTALIYNNNKVILNPGYNLLLTGKYKSYIASSDFKQDGTTVDENINSDLALPFVAYIMYIDYNNYPYESRRFKTLPEIISIRTESISDKISQSVFAFRHATIVQPMNSIELFENKIGSQDSNMKKTYVNFTNTTITEFNKRIIRSNPIADESFENSWRTFNPESYKDITENKGNITNLIALGTSFLVHTEHSLFMFDRDNTLQNGESGTMQLAMPDIFDVDYKEIFASHLGACGLQDSDAWILDEFGYIFYDNDAHRFYKFGAKKIEDITYSIVQFIDKYKPYRVRFANDSESNRILINLLYRYGDSNINEHTLSFNYKINKWISFHSYCFDRAFNTKQMLYLIVDRDKNNNFYDLQDDVYSQLYLINRQDLDIPNKEVLKNGTYNQFDNVRDLNNIHDWELSNISIMVNDSYELIKTLEFITWKLYKISRIITNNTEYHSTPREPLKTPYSGYQLRIYNDNIDSGIINISVDNSNKNKSIMNCKKPWWEYDNWNFNYFRDISKHNKKLANFMSRLYGNYFIICIWFGDITQKCEFETLSCKLVNNKTI